MKLKVLSVSQLNDSLSSYIYANPIFSSIRVMGEVFNLKKTPYGYTFLSLKDDMSKISAMTYLEDFDVKVGDTITVQGKINLYKKGGTYSLLINSYEKSGRGQEYENFKILYEKLEKEGYFKSEIKKAIPKYPQSIGVITSASGAAVQDIMAVIKRRYPIVKLYIYDSKMQGEYVEQNVINGIKRLEEISVDGYKLGLVRFSGINHFIFNLKENKETSFENIIDLVKKYLSNEDYSAFGIMFFDRDNLSMKPYVYVKEVGSGVYENSCASGTTALGYYLKKYKNLDRAKIIQPNGWLEYIIENDEIYIDGPVEIVAEGKVYVCFL